MQPIGASGVLWTAWLVIWLIWAVVQNKKKAKSESLLSRLTYVVPIFLGFEMLYNNFLPWPWLYVRMVPYSEPLAWVGVGFTALGLVYAICARAYLGGNWSGNVTVKVGHELVRSGPYRWTRHPIYTGLLLALVGSMMARIEWRGIFSLVLVWLSLRIKIRREEQFMHETFGEQYDEYKRTTAALVPGLPI